MANETNIERGKTLLKALSQGQDVERAVLESDGTVTISKSEATLQSVDVADVDLLLSFSDGTFVIIPNGALDAISDTPHTVIFNDSKDTLSSLFKMVGISNPAKAGSLRVVSENIDAAQPPAEEYAISNDEPLPETPIAPAPMAKLSSFTGKGPGLGGSGSGEGEVPATVSPMATPQPPVYRVGQKSQQTIEDLLNATGLGMPNIVSELYTSSNFKVTPSGRTDLPLGAFDPNASTSQLAERVSPTKQATIEAINGTAGNDTIDFNPAFSIGEEQWSKTLHLTINNFSDLASIQLVFNAARIAQIPGFELVGLDGAIITRDSPTSNSWHVTPTAGMLLSGVNIAMIYNVNDSAAPVDFGADVIINGHAGPFEFELTNNLNFTWREAVTPDDFTVTSIAGDPLMVLPRDGVGVEVNAGDGNDIINSGAGPDLIHGGNGDDIINAGTGNDVLDGGPGGDSLNGGVGKDTVTYENSVAGIGVTARLDTNGAGNAGEASGDTYGSIENLTGSNYNDILIGDNGSNVLNGGTGDDVLEGMGSADSLIGGTGSNTASYEHATVGVKASLVTSGSNAGLDAVGDTYAQIQNLTGSTHDDTLIGDGGVNTLNGGVGNDILEGLGGADILIGGSGSNTASYDLATVGVTASLDTPGINTGDAADDSYSQIQNLTGSAFNDTLVGDGDANVLNGGAGDDILEGMDGADLLNGGISGTDTASYARASTFTAASLTTGLAGFNSAGDAQGDSYANITNLIGSNYNDILIGKVSANVLNGGSGDDILEGLGGADSLIGGTGSNTASYEHGATGVTASLDNPGINTFDAAGDTYSQIQNLTGSAYNDTLIGDNGINILNGGAGDDILEGMGGNDVLNGGVSGVDTASYDRSSVSVSASLTSITGFISAGDAQGDTYTNITNLTGSNYNDTLIGNGSTNVLNGGGGDDILEGLTGADTLIGGTGNNTASYEHAAAVAGLTGLTISLTNPSANTGDAAGDTYAQIQNLTGSAFNDTMAGDGSSNILNGGTGDDLLEGMGNADILHGGDGIDTASYAHASTYVVASLTSGLAGFSSAGDAAGDTYSLVENLIGTDYNDTLIGNSVANSIYGGAGDDILEGIGGSDTYDGGTGSNTVSYAHASDVGLGVGVTASLLTPLDPTGNSGAASGDLYTNIQNLTGSDFNDTLTGDANNNILIGGGGDDTLTGGAGTDTIYGGLGDDSIIDDGIGVAKLYGEAGDDTFHITSADASVDIIDGGDKTALRLGGIWSGSGDTISWEQASTNRIDVDMINHLIYVRAPVTGNYINFSNVENFTVTGTNSIYITLDNYSNTINATSNGTANIDYVFYQNSLGSLDLHLAWDGVNPNVTGGSSVLDNYNAATHTWTGIGDTLKGIEYVYNASNYADNIYGSDGVNNWLAGSLGSDYINGGTGTDTVYLDPGRSQTVVASLLAATQNTQMGIVMSDTAQGDVYVNIENIYSSGGADQLYGNAGANVLSSNGTMEGFVGTDNLVSLNGANATASYANAGDAYLAAQGITTAASLGVTVNLTGAGFASYFSGVSATSGLGIAVANTGDALGDTYTNNMYGLKGSAFNDILIANSLNNTIIGGDGNDLMEGLGGADSFNGGLGIDTVSYAHATSGVIMDLGTSGLYIAVNSAGVVSDAATVAAGVVTAVDTYAGVENVIGSIFNDTLAGNSLDNVLNGGAGNGNDILDGGANTAGGFDTASYAYATGAVTVSLALSGSQNTINAGSDTLINIEGLLGSDNNDTLIGNANNNWIDGGDGADTLDGGTGVDTLSYASATTGITITLNDLNATHTLSASNTQGDSLTDFENLIGSDYNDTLHGDSLSNVIEGGLGNDILDGGANISGIGDTVSYAHAIAGVTVSLATGVSQNTFAAGGDTLSNFENLTGSDYGDTLTGDNLSNIIAGGEGNDLLYANASGATLIAGVGDQLLGGNGTDTVSFKYSGAVTVTINGTAVHDGVTDTMTGIENLVGSTNADFIYGDGNDNVIDGGGGNDYIDGGAGNDTVTFTSASGAVTVDLNNHSAIGYGTNQLYNMEHIIGSGYDDTLTGNSSNNIIEGGAGNDWMDGGTATDTASYSTAGSGVTVSLAIHTAQNTVGAGTDTLYYNALSSHSFENLTGSAYNDALTGDTAANTLDGGAGDDLLNGGFGADILIGGTGSDTVSYAGSTAVTVNLTSSAYRGVNQGLVYSGFGGAGDATGDTYSGIENVTGSDSNDALMGTTGNNIMTGGLGNDLIYGESGNDVIYANQGRDTVYGEANNDTFYVSSLSGNLPTIIDGGARDAGNIQNHGGNVMVLQDLVNNGSYNMTDLASLNSRLVSIDTLNIRDGASTAITLSSQDIQNMVDNTNASQLFVEANSGDTLFISLAVGQTQGISSITSAANGSVYTDYTIFNSSNVQVAQVHWHTA
ncbi:MAG: hypothetical protein HGB32_03230 [Geobacteraceae bacterium]|nr:hypothetical protein [Geobacteraceae bacterium]NTW79145.1 hypothetical protein [Geobacteraceae bacterium]